MRKEHKIKNIIICLGITAFFILNKLLLHIDIKIDSVTSNIVTFSAIIFAFHTTLIATLYGTRFLQQMYAEIDNKAINNRKIHTIRDYLKFSQRLALTNIIAVFSYDILKHTFEKLNIKDINLVVFSYDILKHILDILPILKLLFGCVIISILFMSIYCIHLLFNFLLISMINSSKKS